MLNTAQGYSVTLMRAAKPQTEAWGLGKNMQGSSFEKQKEPPAPKISPLKKIEREQKHSIVANLLRYN